jgi:hypothetical protein
MSTMPTLNSELAALNSMRADRHDPAYEELKRQLRARAARLNYLLIDDHNLHDTLVLMHLRARPLQC